MRKDYARIAETLTKRKYLSLIENDVFSISDRIRQIEAEYFICYNKISGKYEVHSTANVGNTLCFPVPYKALDSRTLDYCLETNISLHGDNIIKEIEKHNEKIDKSNKRAESNIKEDIANGLAEVAAFGTEFDTLHEGYKKTHIIGG